MNVGSVKTKYYENERPCRRGANKPNQSQFQRQKNAAADLIDSFDYFDSAQYKCAQDKFWGMDEVEFSVDNQ